MANPFCAPGEILAPSLLTTIDTIYVFRVCKNLYFIPGKVHYSECHLIKIVDISINPHILLRVAQRMMLNILQLIQKNEKL